MDGLMVDSEPVWHEVELAVAQAHGGLWTQALSTECIGTGLPHTVELMRERLGLELTVEQGVAELVAGLIARVAQVAIKPGCAELIAAAAGRIPLALASGSTRRIIDAVLDQFGLARRFGVVLSCESVARGKPAPDIFLCAAEQLSRAPAECIVLEDSPAGVQAARAAGMRVIAVPERDKARFVGLADHVVDDLFQARELIDL